MTNRLSKLLVLPVLFTTLLIGRSYANDKQPTNSTRPTEPQTNQPGDNHAVDSRRDRCVGCR